MYSSVVTFIYYKDYERGSEFFKEVLNLKLVMDQGFAQVYQVSDKGFVGIVKAQDGSVNSEYVGGTLVSLTTHNVEEEYNRIKELDVVDLTEIKDFKEIPLKSFFFKDFENHDFEIQQFIKTEDIDLF